ncbi:UNVERIFIED_CONTAM: mutator family transposase, partial [Murimonas intestini]
DFKAVYNAPNEAAGLSELEILKEKWGKKYPYAISSWENNWEDVSSFFQFSGDIRRIMYTTYPEKITMPIFQEVPVNKGISGKISA